MFGRNDLDPNCRPVYGVLRNTVIGNQHGASCSSDWGNGREYRNTGLKNTGEQDTGIQDHRIQESRTQEYRIIYYTTAAHYNTAR